MSKALGDGKNNEGSIIFKIQPTGSLLQWLVTPINYKS
jgi:hypothetical protein